MRYINKIFLIKTFSIGAALAAVGIQCIEANETGKNPNILYILADDLGYSDVGFMGNKDIHTPQLDKLAQTGVVLESLYAQPICSPTRAALLTGRYPVSTGRYGNVPPHSPNTLSLEEQTLAQSLRMVGYETALCGKWHLGEFQTAYLPTHRGFDHQYGEWLGQIDYFTHASFADANEIDWHRDDQPCMDEGYSTHLLSREACKLIREKDPDKPLFLYLAFNTPHAPLQVPDEYLKQYDNLTGGFKIYASMITAMDEAIGQVVAALDEKGLRHNTLIIFSSDNGSPNPTSNRPLREGKGTIYEGGVRVCGFACWPGHIPSGRIEEPIHIVDWYPTLIKLAKGSLKQKLPLDGHNIWPLLTKGVKSPHHAILLCGTRQSQAAIRIDDWKLLLNPNTKTQKNTTVKPNLTDDNIQLYNLATDIGETKNLLEVYPRKVKTMRKNLDVLLKGAVH